LRINYYYIKVALLLGVVVFLYAFSNERNSSRRIDKIAIEFKGDDNLFITRDNVSKLLIQNEQPVTSIAKEVLVLNSLENTLNLNPMIKEAQVFVDVEGTLTAQVEQKKPIARVYTNVSYYIDDQGSYMPLSANYSARVPLVTGSIDKKQLQSVYKIAHKVQADEFLRKHVVEIQQDKNKQLQLKLRGQIFTVRLGNLEQLDKKINNLKAFYKKALKDNTLQDYQIVDLKFDNQVICTK
jgi:cell division protein FtsQ